MEITDCTKEDMERYLKKIGANDYGNGVWCYYGHYIRIITDQSGTIALEDL